MEKNEAKTPAQLHAEKLDDARSALIDSAKTLMATIIAIVLFAAMSIVLLLHPDSHAGARVTIPLACAAFCIASPYATRSLAADFCTYLDIRLDKRSS